MKANEFLLAAIGEIDEKYIAEAARPRSTGRLTARIGAIAASFLVTVSIVIGILGGAFDLFSGKMEPSGGGNSAGSSGSANLMPTISSDTGSAKLVGVDSMQGSTVRLVLYNTVEEMEVLLLESEDTPIEEGITPIIRCDGESCDSPPTEAGSYRLYIEFPEGKDYSAIYFSGIGTLSLTK